MNFHLSWFKFSMPGGNITILWFLGNLACWFTVEQLVNLSLSLPQEQGIPHDLRRRLRSFFLSNKHQAQFAAWIFHNLDECVVGLLVVLFIFWVFLIVILICDVFCFCFCVFPDLLICLLVVYGSLGYAVFSAPIDSIEMVGHAGHQCTCTTARTFYLNPLC